MVAKGRTRATDVLRSDVQVDLRAVPPATFEAAVLHFTGSKSHNIAIRAIARARGLKISEYGVFKGRRRIAGLTLIVKTIVTWDRASQPFQLSGRLHMCEVFKRDRSGGSFDNGGRRMASDRRASPGCSRPIDQVSA